eukprot:GEMP01092265.1.p1 GENE.GEMP01092265.1~~GEMP01092265.1.p1  ORF type:complete len:188 (+),score=39.41 GEMP01092265.1:69-632(+)
MAKSCRLYPLPTVAVTICHSAVHAHCVGTRSVVRAVPECAAMGPARRLHSSGHDSELHKCATTSDAPLETLSGLQGANTSESATLYRRPYSTYSAQHQAHVCSHAHAAAALQQQYDSSVHQFCQWQQAALARQWTEQSSNLAPYEAWEEEPTDCGAKTEVNSSPPFMGLFPSAFDVKGKNNLFFYSG